jgi:hypothetical protein
MCNQAIVQICMQNRWIHLLQGIKAPKVSEYTHFTLVAAKVSELYAF